LQQQQQQQQRQLRARQSQSTGPHPHGLQKHPGSVNSTESDGSNMQSGASADSQRSVYLHATTVADIPTVTNVSGPI